MEYAGMYKLKPMFMDWMRPVSGFLVKLGVKPNHVTISNAVMCLVVGAGMLFVELNRLVFLIFPLACLLRTLLDVVDGQMAREHDLKTVSGLYFNEIGGVVCDTFLITAFYPFVEGVGIFWLVLFAGFSAAAEMSGILSRVLGCPRQYNGPGGKGQRMVLLCAAAMMFVLFGVNELTSILMILMLVVGYSLCYCTIQLRYNQMKIDLAGREIVKEAERRQKPEEPENERC